MITFTELDIVLMIVMIGMLEGLTIFFAYFLIPITNRIKFLNKLTRKNLGMIEIAEKGNDIRRYITNFSKRVAEVGNKIFVLLPEAVYYKDGVKCIHFNEVDAIDPATFKGSPARESEVVKMLKEAGHKIDKRIREELREVVTVEDKKIYFLNPVSMKKDKPKEEYKNPEIIKSIFMEQKALAETQALLSDKMMRYLLIGACISGVLAMGMVFMNGDKIDNQVMPKLDQLSAIPEMKTDITAIKDRITALGQPSLPIGTTIPILLPNTTGG